MTPSTDESYGECERLRGFAVMHLRFNSDRLIARLAAEASEWNSTGGPLLQDRPWRQPPRVQSSDTPRPLGGTAAGTGELPPDDPRRCRLEEAVRATVVGDLDAVGRVLATDAECWSPSTSSASLSEAESGLEAQAAVLRVTSFDVNGLWWCDPVVIAEWHVEAKLSGPLLLGDDVLVDRTGRGVSVSGATVAGFRGDRVAVAHTYFDEATIIEQVLFG